MTEQHDPAVSKRIFRQLIAQTPGCSTTERQKILFALTLQTQRLRQFALFAKQAIGFILGAIYPMQLSHHLDNGRRRLQ